MSRIGEADSRKFIFITAPVYREKLANKAHSRKLEGYVAVVYNADFVIQEILRDYAHHGIQIELRQIVNDSDEVMFSSLEKGGKELEKFQFRYVENIASTLGQGFVLTVALPKAAISALANWTIWVTLAGGIIFTALFGAFLLVVTGRSESIARDVDERTHDLLQAREAAKKSAAAKSEFLANMSHEIRTPLTGIMGMARLLGESRLAPQERRYAAIINNSADALLQIIDDILDFSKIEAGKLRLEQIPFRLKPVCTDVVSLFEIRAIEKRIELKLEFDNDCDVTVIGDPGRLRQVLFNLVSNAIKFTSKGHVILNVTLEKADNTRTKINFRVTDSGIGVPREKQEQIFSKFDQVDNSTSRKYGGTGLGLAISRQLVNMMGAEIYLKSVLDLGSTFYFTIPFANALAAEGEDRQEKAVHFSGVRALLVEDNLVNEEVIRSFLNRRGMEVSHASNGQEAIDAILKGHFDIVFMDCQMPVMDGYTATRKLRHEYNMNDLPIIGITARAFLEDRQKCLDEGMSDYLKKPIIEHELDKILLAWLPASRQGAAIDGASKSWSEEIQLLDLLTLQNLRSVLDDKFAHVVRIYFSESETLFRQLGENVAAGAYEKAEFAAHALKTSSGQLGARKLHEQMKQIESLCVAANRPALEEKVPQAFETFNEVVTALRQQIRSDDV